MAHGLKRERRSSRKKGKLQGPKLKGGGGKSQRRKKKRGGVKEGASCGLAERKIRPVRHPARKAEFKRITSKFGIVVRPAKR